LGFSQITRITPWRRMILHLGHMRLTDGLTFMLSPGVVCTTPSFRSLSAPRTALLAALALVS
jgi:hypothetical protein